jgi:hypothetical protein
VTVALLGEAMKTCLVVSPTGERDSPEQIHSDWLISEIIEPVVREVPGFVVIRADKYGRAGSIDAQVIHYLLHSELVIADLSTPSAPVFYDIAVRHMARKPIIHMYREGEKLPFEPSSCYSIAFSRLKPSDLRNARIQLRHAVDAVLDDAYMVVNPISRFLEPNHLTQLIAATTLRPKNTGSGPTFATPPTPVHLVPDHRSRPERGMVVHRREEHRVRNEIGLHQSETRGPTAPMTASDPASVGWLELAGAPTPAPPHGLSPSPPGPETAAIESGPVATLPANEPPPPDESFVPSSTEAAADPAAVMSVDHPAVSAATRAVQSDAAYAQFEATLAQFEATIAESEAALARSEARRAHAGVAKPVTTPSGTAEATPPTTIAH